MPWYTNFFHGLVQQAWKEAQDEEQTAQEVDFICDLLALQPGQRVLDVFCGYGRHALELARLGCVVTGVDISEEYIAEIQTVAQDEQLPIKGICADFMVAPLEQSYEAAYCFGNSFSFFPYDDMRRFLQKIADQLPVGGKFMADTGMVAESVLPDFQERSWMKIGDLTFLMENEYEVAESRINSHLTYLQNGQTESRTAQHYVYTYAELRRLFREAGLEITETFSALDGSEFVLGDERLLILAEKLPD
ncbi:class I SAM-dependent methyltransferase [Tellurirhabdus bombi]|uniref:class I SAM-dependent methyltransferase n=1 Tax=Tellurirhabdus bombi TaxID=2907205 RepID=UPI001F467A12|nr:class I SAM-dependent methyltransferase [Tellurirhabdus bombi]